MEERENNNPRMVSSHDIALDNEYVNWIHDIKKRYGNAHIKSAIKVNSEQLLFNWQLGRDIVERAAEQKWGKGVVEQLSLDLQAAFPHAKGFSARNLWFMKQWYSFYASNNQITELIEELENSINIGAEKLKQVASEIHEKKVNQAGSEMQGEKLNQAGSEIQGEKLNQAGSEIQGEKLNQAGSEMQGEKLNQAGSEMQGGKLNQAGSEIAFPTVFSYVPWKHHILIVQKCKTIPEALFYIKRTVEEGLSRNALDNSIRAGMYYAAGRAVTNFNEQLPLPQGLLAQELLKEDSTNLLLK